MPIKNEGIIVIHEEGLPLGYGLGDHFVKKCFPYQEMAKEDLEIVLEYLIGDETGDLEPWKKERVSDLKDSSFITAEQGYELINETTNSTKVAVIKSLIENSERLDDEIMHVCGGMSSIKTKISNIEAVLESIIFINNDKGSKKLREDFRDLVGTGIYLNTFKEYVLTLITNIYHKYSNNTESLLNINQEQIMNEVKNLIDYHQPRLTSFNKEFRQALRELVKDSLIESNETRFKVAPVYYYGSLNLKNNESFVIGGEMKFKGEAKDSVSEALIVDESEKEVIIDYKDLVGFLKVFQSGFLENIVSKTSDYFTISKLRRNSSKYLVIENNLKVNNHYNKIGFFLKIEPSEEGIDSNRMLYELIEGINKKLNDLSKEAVKYGSITKEEKIVLNNAIITKFNEIVKNLLNRF